jgi:hypothetical protein
MADEKQLAIIRGGSNAWSLWRDANPDVIPNLAGADFVEANRSYANLGGADIRKANLGTAHLMGANLSWRISARLIYTKPIFERRGLPVGTLLG